MNVVSTTLLDDRLNTADYFQQLTFEDIGFQTAVPDDTGMTDISLISNWKGANSSLILHMDGEKALPEYRIGLERRV